MKGHVKLGELLLQSGAISREQLDEALAAKGRSRQRLGQALIHLGFVTEQQIARILAEQLGLPFVDLDQHDPCPEAIALLNHGLATKYSVFPLSLQDNTLVLAMADPLDIRAEDAVRAATRFPVKAVVATESQVLDHIVRHYSEDQEAYDLLSHLVPDSTGAVVATADTPTDAATLLKVSGFDSVIRAVNALLSYGVRQGASDIHLEPFEESVRVRYRVDGHLRTVLSLPSETYPAIVSRLKVLAALDITETRRPQDGSFRLAVANRQMGCRVSTIRTSCGEKTVIRLLDNTMRKVSLDGLGLLPHHHEALKELLEQPQGLLLVTGPTGSGKTTSLYAALNYVRSDALNIVTIEDPIEAYLYGVNQVQVNEMAGVTFAKALRSILRQDPNVIMVGEVRDRETAEIAVRSSLTGHLVLATLHTNDACSAPTRLIDMGVEPYLLSASLIGVVAQRLVRRLCPECSRDAREPVGCPQCGQAGYSGRIGIFEVLTVDARLRRLLHADATSAALEQAARASGFQSLREDAEAKVKMGWTTAEQVAFALGTGRSGLSADGESSLHWSTEGDEELPVLRELLIRPSGLG